jgi:S-adenosylmethionine:tRNA-ribosyltransferase-isomerase (queuine synthetase)
MITPAYKFKLVEGLITNFHLPKSTLLLLIASLVGPDWKKVFEPDSVKEQVKAIVEGKFDPEIL